MDFDHLINFHLWRERASGWLVSFRIQFRGWKIPIQVGVWRGNSGISWRFNVFCIFRCNIHGISWFLLVQHILSTISSLYCIFFPMEGLLFGWAIVIFGRDSHGPFMIVIRLIYYFIHFQKFTGRNTQKLYVKVIFKEQTMTIFPLYGYCALGELLYYLGELIMIHLWL